MEFTRIRLSSNNNLMAVTVDSASYGIAISSIGNSMINSNISGSSFLNFDASPFQFVNLSNDTVDYSYEIYNNSLSSNYIFDPTNEPNAV